MSGTHCVVFGATGYLGTRLVPELLSAGHAVRVMARHPAKLADVPWRDRVEVFEGDVTDPEAVRRALAGQDVLYYLVHSLMRSDFVEFDAHAASIAAAAAADAQLSRIVYMGGIIPAEQKLSDHLASRAEVGRLLRASGVPTVELRAAAIIGAGSASFEMMRYLTDRLPVMIAPRWLRTTVQPIAIGDVLYYLTHAANLPPQVNRSFDIGGPDRFTYMEMIRKYAAIARLPRRPALPVPVLTPWLSAQWVDLVTPLPRPLAVSLMKSLENDVVCADHDIAEHIPDPAHGLVHYEDAVERALAHVRDSELRTRWSAVDGKNAPSNPLPTDPDWAGGALHEDVRQRRVPVDGETLWRAIESVGAEHGWSAAPLAWSLRGWLGAVAGARDGRRGPHRLHTGEALEWWRVEHLDRPRKVRLRADVPLPGRLWLEMSVRPGDNGEAVYHQRAVFQPYGLAGQAFWAALALTRDAVFGGIARSITSTANGLAARAQRGHRPPGPARSDGAKRPAVTAGRQ